LFTNPTRYREAIRKKIKSKPNQRNQIGHRGKVHTHGRGKYVKQFRTAQGLEKENTRRAEGE